MANSNLKNHKMQDLTEGEYYELESKYHFYFSNILNKWVYDFSYFDTKNELINYLITLKKI